VPPAARLASRAAPNQCHDPEEITPVSRNARLALHCTFSGITSDRQEKQPRDSEENKFACKVGKHICLCHIVLLFRGQKCKISQKLYAELLGTSRQVHFFQFFHKDGNRKISKQGRFAFSLSSTVTSG